MKVKVWKRKKKLNSEGREGKGVGDKQKVPREGRCLGERLGGRECEDLLD